MRTCLSLASTKIDDKRLLQFNIGHWKQPNINYSKFEAMHRWSSGYSLLLWPASFQDWTSQEFEEGAKFQRKTRLDMTTFLSNFETLWHSNRSCGMIFLLKVSRHWHDIDIINRKMFSFRDFNTTLKQELNTHCMFKNYNFLPKPRKNKSEASRICLLFTS